MDQEKIAKLAGKIEEELSEIEGAQRKAQHELDGLEKALETIGSENRENVERSISEWETKLDEITSDKERLQGCETAVREYKAAAGAGEGWDQQIRRLTKQHKREKAAAMKKIQTLDAYLSSARQDWFLGKGQRSEIGKLKAAIAENQAILDDLGELDQADGELEAIPALLAGYQDELDEYRGLLDQAGAGLEVLDIEQGVDGEIRASLDLAIEGLEASGRKLSFPQECGRAGQ